MVNNELKAEPVERAMISNAFNPCKLGVDAFSVLFTECEDSDS